MKIRIVSGLGLAVLLSACAGLPAKTHPARDPALARRGWEMVDGPIFMGGGIEVQSALGCDKSECGGSGFVAVAHRTLSLSQQQFDTMRSAISHSQAGDPLSSIVQQGIGAYGNGHYILTGPPKISAEQMVVEMKGQVENVPGASLSVFTFSITRSSLDIVVAGGKTMDRARQMLGMKNYLQR